MTVGKHSFGYLPNNDGFKKSGAAPKKDKTYVVKSGDTLQKIAKANKTTVDALVKKNSIKDPDKIKIGQEL